MRKVSPEISKVFLGADNEFFCVCGLLICLVAVICLANYKKNASFCCFETFCSSVIHPVCIYPFGGNFGLVVCNSRVVVCVP